MCGITGFAGFRNTDLLRKMTDRLRHRGPDDEGFYFGGECSLGHRRLSIMDPAHGRQPMSDPTGRVTVIFNGQIYNYRELRRDLSDEYSFHTNCDTEILPYLYLRYGREMVRHLRGMFAIAVWDNQEHRLVLFRDRLGIKPLYYAERFPCLLFASEPKSLLCSPETSKEMDATALDAYLRLLYIPPPWSIYRGIRQLPPGHTLTWEPGKAIRVESYWNPQPNPIRTRNPEEWAEAIAPVLEESIRMRTMSDVPLGAFLSGGIDSSTIVAVLAEENSRPVETFCVGFDEEGRSYEERPIARCVADYFGTHHHEIEISLNLVNNLEAMVRGFDEPFGNPTAMLTYELSRFTRQNVTVTLAGDGGDELFGGYPRYRGLLLSEKLRRLPRILRAPVQRLVGGGESSTARNRRRWMRLLLEGCDLPPDQRYESWVGYASENDIDRLLSRDLLARVQQSPRVCPVRKFFNDPREVGVVERAVFADLHGFLPENVLRYSDRMSMAHSLEIRVPFTDHRLVETLLQVPACFNVGWLASKRILKKIMKDRLPAQVLKRSKLGFNPPMGIWLQNDRFSLVSEWLHPDVVRKRGLFQVEEIRRLVSEHQSGRRDHGLRLWSLIVLEAWQRIYQDG